MKVDATSDDPLALQSATGESYKMIPNTRFFDRAMQQGGSMSSAIPEREVPPDLLCPICDGIMDDAVQVKCCKESFCDACIREYLMENMHTCMLCKTDGISPESLIPNKNMRSHVANFLTNKADKGKSVGAGGGG